MLTELFNKGYDQPVVTLRQINSKFKNKRQLKSRQTKCENLGIEVGAIDETTCRKWSGSQWYRLCEFYKVKISSFKFK
jgi:hypothetical protein